MTILVLDGGMGTTLESLGYDVSGDMWGGELIQHDPSALEHVHAQYAAAGADIVSTATYQVSPSEFSRVSGLTDEHAAEAMRKAVLVARQAAPSARIALSLGPFGATLKPAQEYDGLYPPPYGPQGFVKNGLTSNASASRDDDLRYQQALTQWHLERLRVYANDETIWRSISYIAFETIPLLREIRAIREAIRSLRGELSHRPKSECDKPFWISSSYPTGKPIQKGTDGQPVHLYEVVEALLGGPATAPVPDGIGINCTKPSLLAALMGELSSLIKERNLGNSQPWLVVYPDSGAVYDVEQRTWSELDHTTAEAWAKAIVRLGRTAETSGLWKGLILGGCCKTDFKHVTALRREVDNTETA